jgi:hypothetical protein
LGVRHFIFVGQGEILTTKTNKPNFLSPNVNTREIREDFNGRLHDLGAELVCQTPRLTVVMATCDVKDGLIERVTLYKEAFWLLRWDILPFLVLYGAGLAAAVSEAHDVKVVGLVLVPVGLTAHLLMFLFAQTSVNFRAHLGKSKATSLAEASWVHVVAAKNAGRDRLVPVYRSLKLPPSAQVVVLKQSYSLRAEFFQYQEVTYYWDEVLGKYARLSYPTVFTADALQNWQGHVENTSIAIALQRWGLNEFHIPIPHFLDLYMVSCFLSYSALYIPLI